MEQFFVQDKTEFVSIYYKLLLTFQRNRFIFNVGEINERPLQLAFPLLSAARLPVPIELVDFLRWISDRVVADARGSWDKSFGEISQAAI